MFGAERFALQKKDNCTVIYDNMWYVLPSFVWLSCHPCTQPEDSILNGRVSNDSMAKIMWQHKQERLPVDAAMNNAPCQQTEALCLSVATLRLRTNHKLSLPLVTDSLFLERRVSEMSCFATLRITMLHLHAAYVKCTCDKTSVCFPTISTNRLCVCLCTWRLVRLDLFTSKRTYWFCGSVCAHLNKLPCPPARLPL